MNCFCNKQERHIAFPMKKIFFLLIILSFKPSFAHEGFFTFGYSWGVMSRGGFYLGYNFNKNKAVEFHVGGVPHVLTYGLSLKLKPLNKNDQFYLICGLSTIKHFGYIAHNEDGSTQYTIGSCTGFNFGAGNETMLKKSSWRFMYEGGFFIATSAIKAKKVIFENGDIITTSKISSLSNSGFIGFGFIKY